MKKIEYEDFYVIEEKDFSQIIQVMFENKYLHCGKYNFCIEMPTQKNELHFLSFNITNPKSRERIKIKYKKHGYQINYEKKKFVDGHREEEATELNDFTAVCDILNEMEFKASLIKTSLKWPCIDYIEGKKFYLKAEICCAVDTNNFTSISDPLFYFEIESADLADLNLFYQTDLNQYMHPFFKGVEFQTGNKYRKCIKLFDEHAIKFNSRNDAINKTKKVFEIFTKQKFDRKYFDFDNQRVRGDNNSKQHLEKGNCIEKEIKFIPIMKNEEYISRINEIVCDKFHIIKAAPRIVFDLYYDTEDDLLYKNNNSFRFRCRKKGEGWVACFKSNSVDNNIVLSRNNIRTNMTVEDIVRKLVVGEAVTSLLKETEKTITEFYPSILIVQRRDRFAIRPNNVKQIVCGEKSKNITYYNQRSELVHIIFDEFEIYNAKDIEILPLLYSQEIISKQYNSIKFKTVEIEANGRGDIEMVANSIFKKLELFFSDDVKADILNKGKYVLARDMINEKNFITNL